jgi:hypothetical protein
MTLSGYQGSIVTCTGCTPKEAPLVEELMRLRFPTLDNLRAPEFKREARTALRALRSERA